MNITLERATPADAETLVKVQIAAFHYDSVLYPDVELGGPPGYDSVDTALERMDKDIYYKILSDGEIVGGIVIFDKGQGHFHLDLIYIDPNQHGRGIGSQAMTLLEAAHPATKWTLDTPTYAIRNQHFYEKFGYLKVGEHPEDDNITLIAYEKRI